MTRRDAVLKPAATAIALGLLQAASIAAPWNGQPLWWLQIASLAGLVFVLHSATSAWRAALTGWLFATAWLCGTVWWLFISMHTYGGLPAPLAAFAVLALCGFLSSYYAAAAAVLHGVRLRGAAMLGVATTFAAAWLLAELCRDTLLTGFPWGAGGYAHVDGPLSVLAPWVGVYGIGFVAAWLAALAAAWLARRPLGRRDAIRWGGIVALFALPSVLGLQKPVQLPTSGVSVALLQGQVSQGEKFEPARGIPDALAWYRSTLLQGSASLAITPETAIPLLPRQLPPDYLNSLHSELRSAGRAALVGIPLGDLGTGYTNSSIGLVPSAAQGVYRYDKHHLVPFGEFIPFGFRWFTEMMNIPLGDFDRGGVAQPSFEWAGERWAPNICYEDLFGDELAARFVNTASAPTVLVNMSNIGWFGQTVAIHQHLHISRLRAMELGRPMIRATNTGATAIINHRGEVTHRLPSTERGVLVGMVQGQTSITPFAWWAARFGLWPLWLLAVTLVVLTLALARRKSVQMNAGTTQT